MDHTQDELTLLKEGPIAFAETVLNIKFSAFQLLVWEILEQDPNALNAIFPGRARYVPNWEQLCAELEETREVEK